MAPKLKEMDEVIKLIHMRMILHQTSSKSRTLLVVVSDHGMTDGGNHGGSSYEETDTLALFIGLGSKVPHDTPSSYNVAYQVDIAPTLAILFGVPIPRNNVGILLLETLNSFTDEQKLRALQLNSWQLLRLLQAHSPGLLCGQLLSVATNESALDINVSVWTTEEKLHHFYSKAMIAHKLWEFHQSSDLISNSSNDFKVAIESYNNFLRNASEWLSNKATDKPTSLLMSGVATMLISCILLLNLLFWLLKGVHFTQKSDLSHRKDFSNGWKLDETFVFLGTIMHVLSLCASSMVEEEQYTWHFLTSTLYLIFLLKTIQCLLCGQEFTLVVGMKGEDNSILYQSSDGRDNARRKSYKWKYMHYYQIFSVFIVLICGRILKGWHQGGVNWTYLSDISKWLKQAGDFKITLLQIVSLLLVLILSSFALFLVRSRKGLVLIVAFSLFVSALLVFLHIMEHQSYGVLPVDHSSTLIAQIFYSTVGITVILTVLASPWVLPVWYQSTYWRTNFFSDFNFEHHLDYPMLVVREYLYLIGATYAASWCLLQLLLQQPVNAVPILLILSEILASMVYFLTYGERHEQWVKVAALYFVGMAGHFGLGNSNSLATIDVAGAFIGISDHSTVLSGILMFIITYASPMLSFLSIFIYVSEKDIRSLSDQKNSELSTVLQTITAFPCLLPLVFNSVVLTTFTIILLVMRNHLFVWSVFSPKYLYLCAATLCVYIGVSITAATASYTCIVFFFRRKVSRAKCASPKLYGS